MASETAAKAARAEIQKTSQAVAHDARQVKTSAAHIEDSAQSIQRTSDRATLLAADRTLLAAERTYAAWVRTGLAALAAGVGARALLARLVPDAMVMLAASVLVLFSAFCFCAAVWRELVPRWTDPVPTAPRIPRTILFLVNGSLTLVALGALAGIWAMRIKGGI